DPQDIFRGDGDFLRVRPGQVLPQDLVVHAGGVVAIQAVLTAAARDSGIQDDTVADFEVRDIGADFRNVARSVRAEDVRQREFQGWDPVADPDVESVQARRVDPDDHLVRPGTRVRVIPADLQDLEPAEAGHDDRLQRTTCATAAKGNGPR